MIQPLGNATPATRPTRLAAPAVAPAPEPHDAVTLSQAPGGVVRTALAHAAAGAAAGPIGAVATEADRRLLEAALPELKRATYPGRAEDLLDLAAEPAGQAPLAERLQAMQTLASECRAAENTQQAYQAAREAAAGRSLAQVATEIAALVDASDTRRGLQAFRFLDEMPPPAGMDAATARTAFLDLVKTFRDPEAATRVWTRLEGAPLDEPPAERLRVLRAWYDAGDMYNADLEAGLEAVLKHRRPDESFQAITDSYLKLAGTLKNRREAPRAFDLLRRHTAAPGPGGVTPAEKDAVLRAWLKGARNAEEAEKLYEAAAATPDEGEFLDRLAVQRVLLDRSADRGWGGGTVLDAWGRLAGDPVMTQGTERILRLVPHTSGDEEARRIRDALLAAPSRTYEEKEAAWTALHSAASDAPRRPDRTLDDLLFLMRRIGPAGDLQAAATELAGYLDLARDADEARMALEMPGRGPLFDRMLAAGGHARAARDAAALATTPEAERLLADLMARHRGRDDEGVIASVQLAATLLSLPGSGAPAAALARLPKLDEWKDGVDGSFGRWLQRSVLAGAADRAEATARLEDLATLKETVATDREDLEVAWARVGSAVNRHDQVGALKALHDVEPRSLEKDLEDLDYVCRSLRPGDDLVEQAAVFRMVTRGSNRPRFEYERMRDWLAATGDASTERQRRWATLGFDHGDSTLENAREAIEVPVGAESLLQREALLWRLSTGPEDLDASVGDYRHVSEGLKPTVSLAEAVEAFDVIRRGLGGDRMQARKIFDRLHARTEPLVDLAVWFASHMTLQQDPNALLDRLDQHPEDLKIERRPEEVDIGGITLPVRQGYLGRRPRS